MHFERYAQWNVRSNEVSTTPRWRWVLHAKVDDQQDSAQTDVSLGRPTRYRGVVLTSWRGNASYYTVSVKRPGWLENPWGRAVSVGGVAV